MTDMHTHDHGDGMEDPNRDAPASPAWHNAHRVLIGVAAVALVLWIVSGIYYVNAREEAVVERMGQYVTTPDGLQIATVGPGLHMGLPWPLDRVQKVARQESNQMVLDTFDTPPASVEALRYKLAQKQVPEEFLNEICFPYVITADKNIVHAVVTMYYTIDDVGVYVRAVAEAPDQKRNMREEMLRRIVERQVVAVLGTHAIDAILYRQDTKIDDQLKLRVIEALKTRGGESLLGVTVGSIRLSQARVPEKVKPAFEQAQNAKSNRQSRVDLALAQARGIKYTAEAEATNRQNDAENFKRRVVQEATAEAERFGRALPEWKLNPEVARFNLWQESVLRLLNNAQRVYTVQPGQDFVLPIERQQRMVEQGPGN